MLKRTKSLNRSNSSLRKTGKIKVKSRSPEQITERKKDRDRMWELFNEHWNTRPRRCESCGAILKGDNLSIYHHHLLPKGLKRYEHLKYEIDNLMMLCEKCHTSHENGYTAPAIQTETEWAKQRLL